MTASAGQKKIGARDSISIQAPEGAPGLEVLAGGALEDRLNNRFRMVERQPWRLWVDGGIPGESARSFRWYVRATAKDNQPVPLLIVVARSLLVSGMAISAAAALFFFVGGVWQVGIPALGLTVLFLVLMFLVERAAA